jgi:hypothetical protein
MPLAIAQPRPPQPLFQRSSGALDRAVPSTALSPANETIA